jgi:hypothetical protein
MSFSHAQDVYILGHTASGCVYTCTGVRPVLAGGPGRKCYSGAVLLLSWVSTHWVA